MNTRRDRVIHTGDIHLIFEFEAPPGIRYPQHAPGIDSFDEKDRISKLAEELKAQQIAELDAGRKDKAELADQILDRQRAAKRVRTTEFTDGEIEAAFKFIDLDHNGYVGAAEIRHVLVCMGELITDEEVDMMIKMVDSDGDGQVSFTEFYNVVTDPDPAHTDFVKMAAQEEEDPDQTGDPGQMDAKAHERHKEITLRNKKREMMEAFTVLTRRLFPRFSELQRCEDGVFMTPRRRRRGRDGIDQHRSRTASARPKSYTVIPNSYSYRKSGAWTARSTSRRTARF